MPRERGEPEVACIMKRKCFSAPEQREKRNKTASSCCSSNAVARPTVFKQLIMSHVSSSHFTASTSEEIRACSLILCKMDDLPYITLQSAKEAIKYSSDANFLMQMSEKHKMIWLKEVTPLGFKNEFQQWLDNRAPAQAHAPAHAHAPAA